MSLVDSFALSDYETEEDVRELLDQIEDEMSTLRGFKRGADEKLALLQSAETDD